ARVLVECLAAKGMAGGPSHQAATRRVRARMWRGFVRTALKALASIALLAFATRGVDIVAIRAHLADADPWTIAVAIALMTAISAIHTQRWSIVLNCLGRDL